MALANDPKSGGSFRVASFVRTSVVPRRSLGWGRRSMSLAFSKRSIIAVVAPLLRPVCSANWDGVLEPCKVITSRHFMSVTLTPRSWPTAWWKRTVPMLYSLAPRMTCITESRWSIFLFLTFYSKIECLHIRDK